MKTVAAPMWYFFFFRVPVLKSVPVLVVGIVVSLVLLPALAHFCLFLFSLAKRIHGEYMSAGGESYARATRI